MAKVTVIIPLFNKAAYIKRALDSVLAQTFGDFELLVIDDGSTDGGGEIVHRCGDSRVRLIRQDNAGPPTPVIGGSMKQRRLVAFLDADDEWMPRYLEHNVATLESAGSNVACVSSGYLLYRRPIDERCGTSEVEGSHVSRHARNVAAVPRASAGVSRAADDARDGERPPLGRFCRHGKCVYGEDPISGSS
jgi:glycosyltransferase involved in cell wall biosynthesis